LLWWLGTMTKLVSTLALAAAFTSLVAARSAHAACMDKATAANVIAIRSNQQPLHGELGSVTSQLFAFGTGYFEVFQNGQYWLDACNDIQVGVGGALFGKILTEYQAVGDAIGLLGFPETNQIATVTGDGVVNYFEGGSVDAEYDYRGAAIYLKNGATAAHEIHGANFDFFQTAGEQDSGLGYPTSDQQACTVPGCAPGVVENEMENGFLLSGTVNFPPGTEVWAELTEVRNAPNFTMTFNAAAHTITVSSADWPYDFAGVWLVAPFGTLAQNFEPGVGGHFTATFSNVTTAYGVPGKTNGSLIVTAHVYTGGGLTQLGSVQIQ
jgi:hypothetical protein